MLPYFIFLFAGLLFAFITRTCFLYLKYPTPRYPSSDPICILPIPKGIILLMVIVSFIPFVSLLNIAIFLIMCLCDDFKFKDNKLTRWLMS